MRRVIESTLLSLDGIFSDLWPSQPGSYAAAINAIPKYVFSSTLTDMDWNNTTIVRGEIAAEVKPLKEQDGKDLLLAVRGALGAELLEHGLLDELQFAIRPVFVGEGDTRHGQGATATLVLTGTQTLGTGVVVTSGRPEP